MTAPALIGSPDALTCLARGFDKLAALLALTLGPTQGVVLNDSGGAPERLLDSGTIARRIVELPVRSEDVGAMLLRNMVWGMHERYGDGGATAVVLAQAMVREATRFIVAGANPMRLRRGLERGVVAASEALGQQACPAAGPQMLARLATGVSGDPALGEMLGEMFDLLGAEAALIVEEYLAPYLEREYLDGGRWRGRPAARAFMPDDQPELSLNQPLVLVIDQKLVRAGQVVPLLELAARAPQKPPLLLVTSELSGEALQTLVLNHTQGKLTVGAAIITTGGLALADDLADIALLTGGQLVAEALGRSPERVQPAFFGHARRAVLTRQSLTIIGGGGEVAARQRRIAELRALSRQYQRTDPAWEHLRMRLARLAGGVGILKVGAHTKQERALKKEQAHQAVRVLESALAEGVVPGGGIAYLACESAVRAVCCADPDEALGLEIVAAALAAPLSQLVRNHGGPSPTVVLHELKRLGPGYGFDVLTGDYVAMAEAGVLESLSVVRGALEAAASSAAMAMTTEVIVLHSNRRRERQMRP